MAFIEPSANSVNYKNMFTLEMGYPNASESNKFSDQNTETFNLAGAVAVAVVVCTRLSRQFWEQHPLWLFSVHK